MQEEMTRSLIEYYSNYSAQHIEKAVASKLLPHRTDVTDWRDTVWSYTARSQNQTGNNMAPAPTRSKQQRHRYNGNQTATKTRHTPKNRSKYEYQWTIPT